MAAVRDKDGYIIMVTVAGKRSRYAGHIMGQPIDGSFYATLWYETLDEAMKSATHIPVMYSPEIFRVNVVTYPSYGLSEMSRWLDEQAAAPQIDQENL